MPFILSSQPVTLKPKVLFLSAIWGILFLAGCAVTKNIPEKDYLLINNRFRIDTKKVTAEELGGYLQQVPNKKLFGLFRTNIAFYNWGSKGKDTKFKKWLRTKVGSAPVILDTTLVSVGMKQMGIYLSNKGYFQSQLHDSIVYSRKKASVFYIIRASKPYRIRRFMYAIPDTQLASFIYRDTARCLIKKGRNYDSYLLDDERTRITNKLLDEGFFRFSNSYIAFRVDSTIGSKQMDITLEVTNPVVPSLKNFTTVMESHHKRYFIDKVYIYTDFEHIQTDTSRYDTLIRTFQNADRKGHPSTYYFLHHNRFKVKQRTIAQSIFISPGSCYNLGDLNQTYAQLASLQVFKYINIQFEESPRIPDLNSPHHDLVDARIRLANSPTQSFSITTDGTNSGGALGIQAGLGYQNRNIFRGAQLFRINFSISAQAQAVSSSSGGSNPLFNTLELGVNSSLTFPQFLIPIRPEKLPKHFKPRTTITLGYNYQHQQDYDRHISNVSFGYNWIQSEKLKHTLNPAEIALVKVFPDSAFSALLDQTTDKRLKNQYTNHLVAGLRYTLTFNNQEMTKRKDFVYIRTNFETGGNLFYAINSIFKSPRNDNGNYTLFRLPYSQYVRPDIDFRYYNLLGKNFSLVYRFYGGIGIPYGNSNSLPFEKAFYAGGANGMRGYKMYSLGPGSYHNDTLSGTYNQIGDIQLEGNIEFRFPVYRFIKGALFVDAGNIWILHDSPDLPGGVFKFKNYLNQIAIDFGVGIRLDFDFFIFRLDPAIPIRVPWYPANDRWYFNKMQLKDIVWNFGIGYPF